MKLKGIFSICILSGFMFSACTQEQAEPVAPETEDKVEVVGLYELEASIGELTKTVLSGLEMSWEAGDVIYVYTADGFKPYTTEAGDGKFKGDFEAALKDGKYVALYPAASVSGTSATFTISAEQKFALQSANDLPMVATWQENGKIVFNPVCSILDMPLTVAQGVTLSSVEYVFNGKVGAGEYTYDWTTGAYGTESCGGKLTLTGSFNSGEVYNAVVPGDYKDGFTLTLTDTDNCAMVLTNTKGSALAAGSVQKLGAVSYEQLAPKFTISYDDWAATATLASTPGAGTRYWLSKTVNGEPLAGVAPVNMGSLAAGAIVKLYGYLCSENVAGTGVADGDKLYFVTEYVNGAKTYLRSVEYTYHPDPLEVVLYDDALNSNTKYTAKLAGLGSTKAADYSEDVAFGKYCIRAELSQAYAELRLDIWDNELDKCVNLQSQAMALYNMEFYVKADNDIKGNTYTAIRYNVGKTTGIMSDYQSAWQNFTNLAKETTIPANTWIKVSIPMNQIWLKKKINATNYSDIDLNEYQGYTDAGGRDGWLYSYKEVDRIYINAQQAAYSADNNPTVFLIDHFTIRKSTLNK